MPITSRHFNWPWNRVTLVHFNGSSRFETDCRPTATDEWLTSSRSIHFAFWHARLSCERGIAKLRRSLTVEELQPGLFDLRAEQAWADEQEQQREGIRNSNWFTSWAKRQATIEIEPPQIALVLFTD